MPMWDFYDKTNFVIPSCTSNDSLPSSPLRCYAVVELGTLVSISWVCPGGCQIYVTGNKHFVPIVGVKMSYMSVGVNKGMG